MNKFNDIIEDNEIIMESLMNDIENIKSLDYNGVAIEGFLEKLKEKFMKKKSNDTSANSKSEESQELKFTFKKATASDFENLYKKEAYCAEGLKPLNNETCKLFAKHISTWEGHPEEVHFYYCLGKDLNKYYHLTTNNMYPDDLGIFFIDWSNFDKGFNAASHKSNFRYFSDVVDNNARREIRKNNSFYKNYHSLYGDKWFYGTI